jgi:hypothetical protein
MLAWLDGAGSDPSTPYILFSMIPLAKIPPERRRFLERAGFEGRPDALAPVIFTEAPPEPAREINQTEAVLVLRVIRAILVEAGRGDAARATYAPQLTKTPVLTVRGDPRRPEVSLTFERLDVGLECGVAPTYSPPRDLLDGPRGNAHWAVGFDPLPMHVPGTGERFHFLGIAETKGGKIIMVETLVGESLAPAAHGLFCALAGHRDDESMCSDLPARMTFSSPRLYEAVADGIAELGIPCCLVPHLPLLQDVRNGFVRHLIRVTLDSDGLLVPFHDGGLDGFR